MSVFKGKYISDQEIWSILDDIVKERDEVERQLGNTETIGNPELMSTLARQLHELNKTCYPVEALKSCLRDLADLEELMAQEQSEDDLVQLTNLHEEYQASCSEKARHLYDMLMEKGHLDIEVEDDKDIEILKFIEYAGPEYAWRLGINIGLDVEESRRRLNILLSKGFLERVEGNMLDNYHRAKDWTKHMNHTYYRITREGRHYLRKMRPDRYYNLREQKDTE